MHHQLKSQMIQIFLLQWLSVLDHRSSLFKKLHRYWSRTWVRFKITHGSKRLFFTGGSSTIIPLSFTLVFIPWIHITTRVEVQIWIILESDVCAGYDAFVKQQKRFVWNELSGAIQRQNLWSVLQDHLELPPLFILQHSGRQMQVQRYFTWSYRDSKQKQVNLLFFSTSSRTFTVTLIWSS